MVARFRLWLARALVPAGWEVIGVVRAEASAVARLARLQSWAGSGILRKGQKPDHRVHRELGAALGELGRRLLLVGVVLVVGASRPVAAQSRVEGRYNEQVGGGVANLVLRGPWTAPAWRRPWVRGVIFVTASTVYETLLDGASGNPMHQAWADWRGRAVGYAVTELVLQGGRWLTRR